MPQKKNPDSLELIRGKTGRLFGNVSFGFLYFRRLIFGLDGRLHDDSERASLDIQQGPPRR
jgi:argininosuccinate lyase